MASLMWSSDFSSKCFLVCSLLREVSTSTQVLKELRNYILCIIGLWSLIFSVRDYTSLHFIPIVLCMFSVTIKLV